MKRKYLERWLRDHGAAKERSGSKHDVWHREGVETTVPRHSEIKWTTARGICDQLNVPRPPGR